MNPCQIAINQLIDQTQQTVIGQRHVIKALAIALLTNSHVLLEGLPGTAKTRSVKSLAMLLNAPFGRIQFTPDLLPSDVTGTDVYQEVDGKPQLNFQPGPIFNSIVLADEVNRAPAKVQAALLEAMAEGTITVGKQTHVLPDVFMVLATQNPIEQEGTYPLPEAQMDRFIMKVTVDYPDEEAEKEIVRLVRMEEIGASIDQSQPALENIATEMILEARRELPLVEVSDMVESYIVALVMATRNPQRYSDVNLAQWIQIGSSPRASISLDKCARANAWLNGRNYVEIDDVREVVPYVLGHRFTLSYDALADGVTHEKVIETLLNVVEIG
ncbi:AAA domain-containing protein [Vibrio astriarenae]|uniref:AAA domain-containing protein n=1 Tax=Vibrio astriarenae TaxID=1481923 RepID=A0A7Z2T6H8_9VIBR|nr:MoxR family ATPase [Vibrio astriarenae]QIA65226.1 AAA domain-containing protein [Vibrio astriarenae]